MSTAEQVAAVQRLVRESVAAVDALAPEALRAVLPALAAARDELRSDLTEWLQRVPDGADRFTALAKQQALRALEATLERAAELEPAMRGALGKARYLAGPLSVENLETEITRLTALFEGGIPTVPHIKLAAVLARGEELLWKRHEGSARRYAGAVGADIQQLFAVGVAKHETFDQLVRRLRQLGGGPRRAGAIDPGNDAGLIADGMFRRHKFWADRLVRTELMHAYNVDHDQAIGELNDGRPEGDEPYERKWDASADHVTCSICKGLDGETAPIGGTFRWGYTVPPAHPC